VPFAKVVRQQLRRDNGESKLLRELIVVDPSLNAVFAAWMACAEASDSAEVGRGNFSSSFLFLSSV
jgi:hypothetical protein